MLLARHVDPYYKDSIKSLLLEGYTLTFTEKIRDIQLIITIHPES